MKSERILNDKLIELTGVDENLLKLVTIVLPTNNRQLLIKRAIAFYKNWDCRFIICDSSADRLEETFDENIEYIHCPGISLPKKLSESLTKVETPYVCICADDDFLSQTGILQGVKFLSSNKDYVSVQGAYTQFHWVSDDIRCYPLYEDLPGTDINSESAADRVVKSAKTGMHQVYSLHLTQVLQASLDLYKEIKYIPGLEYCTSLVGMFYGKHKILPFFWMARDSGRYTLYNNSHDNKSSNDLNLSNLLAFLSSDSGVKFKNEFAELFHKISKGSVNEGIKLFEQAFSILTEKISAKAGEKIKSNSLTFLKMTIPRGLRKWKSKQYDMPGYLGRRFLFKNSPFKKKVFKSELDSIKQIIKQHGNIPTLN